jgi:hypothetical protein
LDLSIVIELENLTTGMFSRVLLSKASERNFVIRSLSAFCKSRRRVRIGEKYSRNRKGEMCVGEMVVRESEWHRLFGGLAVYEKITLKWISEKNCVRL